jgi:transitional endoplasmic reticulum ATPase
MLENATKGLELPLSWHRSAAQHEDLTPAVIMRAGRVVEQMAEHLESDAHARAMERVLNGVLTAQGHRPLSMAGASPIGEFRLDAANADHDLHEIVASLKQHPSARLCLYGPPGTGKSAFGRFLSDKLGRPLHVKRASDLLSPFLGLTEQAFARMFREAQEDKAILLLDEADTFLQDRRSARHSWEISEVNEMLTQVEAFEGLLVATTNLMDNLDPAVMRRFDLKIHFNYLTPHQAAQLLNDTVARLGLPTDLETMCAERLADCRYTPGDFAVVARQAKFRKMGSLKELVLALKQEAAHRGRSFSRPPGFL